jgi:hypothetical protein
MSHLRILFDDRAIIQEQHERTKMTWKATAGHTSVEERTDGLVFPIDPRWIGKHFTDRSNANARFPKSCCGRSAYRLSFF